jgi:hypothetical protein
MFRFIIITYFPSLSSTWWPCIPCLPTHLYAQHNTRYLPRDGLAFLVCPPTCMPNKTLAILHGRREVPVVLKLDVGSHTLGNMAETRQTRLRSGTSRKSRGVGNKTADTAKQMFSCYEITSSLTSVLEGILLHCTALHTGVAYNSLNFIPYFPSDYHMNKIPCWE